MKSFYEHISGIKFPFIGDRFDRVEKLMGELPTYDQGHARYEKLLVSYHDGMFSSTVDSIDFLSTDYNIFGENLFGKKSDEIIRIFKSKLNSEMFKSEYKHSDSFTILIPEYCLELHFDDNKFEMLSIQWKKYFSNIDKDTRIKKTEPGSKLNS